MFVFNRSAAAVFLPLALLLVVALWSNRGDSGSARQLVVAASGNAQHALPRDSATRTASNDRLATQR